MPEPNDELYAPKSGSKRRRLRARLFAQQKGLCFWCKTPMRLLTLAELQKMRNQPPNLCTLDHLEPRWHPRRGEFNGQLRKVAACSKCNNERDRQQLRQVPVELLRLSSAKGMKAIMLAKKHETNLSHSFPVLRGLENPRLVVTFDPEPPQRLLVSLAELASRKVK